jgi:nucleotide-binding universal stress UspA family protein
MRTPDTPLVVVGVIGTAAGLAAVRLGAREAVARNAELRVVHAFTWPDRRYGREPQGYAPARSEAARIVERAIATARRSVPGVRVRGLVVDGPTVRVLVQQSRAATLLVLGDDDLSVAPRAPIDSILVQAVSRAFCPTLVARGPRPPGGPLLAGVDGSAASLLALRFAADEAARRAVAVDVVHVVERPGAEEEGRRLLDEAVAAVPQLKRPRPRLLIGDPARALVRASQRSRMVLVGPRGRGGAALLGPVAQQLLRRGACPTLFVHGITAQGRCSAGTVPTAGALAS